MAAHHLGLPAVIRALPALAAVLALAIAGCGSGDSGSSSSKTDANDPRTDATQPQQAPTAGGCEQVAIPQPRDPGKQKKPTAPLDSSKNWTLKFKTNCGDFSVVLDVGQSPNATASLVALAKADYFDGTFFHRIVPGFVIQGGDPTGSGTGGPGYTTIDKPPRNAKYTRGVVAMAKAGNEPPGAAGSQFYVVTGRDAGLPPDYAIVGKVSQGLDVVKRIGKLGDPTTEQPTEAIVIDDVEVSET
jgi:peptidyl-prolyl cis-trans isomerase B (cyclophilin B)